MSDSEKRGADQAETADYRDAESIVRILLAAAGLPAHTAEISGHAAKYQDFRTAIDALYAVQAARYADPALRFDATPGPARWGA